MTMRFALLLTAAVLWLIWVVPGFAHDWYSKKIDPVYGKGCCGGSDCARLPTEIPGVLTAEEAGYRVRLTVEQAKEINEYRREPFDHLIPWDRVQPSEDGNYHICIMSADNDMYYTDPRDGTFCFFAPPST
jgi:hypothetical protein